MEENNYSNVNEIHEVEEASAFDLKNLYTLLILNWQWFVLSLLICLSTAYVYLRYATPIYQATAKLLIKDDESTTGSSSRNRLVTSTTLGMITNSTGIDNEMEILKSQSIAEAAVKDLKLYVLYKTKGTIKDAIVYKNQPVNIDLDPIHLQKLTTTISLTITRTGNTYNVTGKYDMFYANEGKSQTMNINQKLSTLPATIKTKIGIITLSPNGKYMLKEGTTLMATIVPPSILAARYAGGLGVGQTSKNTTIAALSLTDASPQRALDYLEGLVVAYNRAANEDKNEIAVRTEDFINGRLEKISIELGNTDGAVEQFKRNNQMIEYDMTATQTMSNANQYDQKLIDINMQIALINNLASYIDNDDNRYQVIPSNIGLTDQSTTAIINNYNKVALERSSLLRTAGELNPSLKPLNAQLDDLLASIRKAMSQAKNNLEIQRNSISAQYNKYQGQILNSPEQQRIMNEIGRQQEVQTALYTMLLQKREENSISLAATADKGRLIDRPAYAGKVKPRKSMIMMIAFVMGIGIPLAILLIINFFKYKIEGHEDVVKLTKIPVIADVAVASESAKTKADIVVHENKNNMMEEIFRAMRTNLQFMLEENQKVVMVTSSIAGEGKTFCVSNLAISFALLGKKVALVGLDIRKPRLAELFEINDHRHGITPLLAMANPTWEDVKNQIVPCGINDNLDLLMAGPVPPNPAEMVERKQLNQVFEHLREHYDFIFIDTAPVGLVTDTLQIGRVADASIVVCRADFTPKDNILMVNDFANENKLPKMSIVINGIDMSKKKHGYYYGYGKYGRYGQYGRKYKSYGRYNSYGHYGSYGNYTNSNYGDKNDTSVKL